MKRILTIATLVVALAAGTAFAAMGLKGELQQAAWDAALEMIAIADSHGASACITITYDVIRANGGQFTETLFVCS